MQTVGYEGSQSGRDATFRCDEGSSIRPATATPRRPSPRSQRSPRMIALGLSASGASGLRLPGCLARVPGLPESHGTHGEPRHSARYALSRFSPACGRRTDARARRLSREARPRRHVHLQSLPVRAGGRGSDREPPTRVRAARRAARRHLLERPHRLSRRPSHAAPRALARGGLRVPLPRRRDAGRGAQLRCGLHARPLRVRPRATARLPRTHRRQLEGAGEGQAARVGSAASGRRPTWRGRSRP
jgi:hypothetical protein